MGLMGLIRHKSGGYNDQYLSVSSPHASNLEICQNVMAVIVTSQEAAALAGEV